MYVVDRYIVNNKNIVMKNFCYFCKFFNGMYPFEIGRFGWSVYLFCVGGYLKI